MKDKKLIELVSIGISKGKSCLTNLITFYHEMNGLVDEAPVPGPLPKSTGHCLS